MNIKLIDSEYNTINAKELILALINDKIKFLGQQSFSYSEKTGDYDPTYKKRISELKEKRDEIISFFDGLDSDLKIKIDGEIKIKIK